PWYSQYNGSNFLDLPLPITNDQPAPPGGGTSVSKRKQRRVPPPPSFEGLPMIEFMRDLHNLGGEPLAGYCYTTLRLVRSALLGVRLNDPNGHKEEIRAFVHQHGRVPSRASKDSEERRLADLVKNYCGQSSETYDPEFANEMAPHRRRR